MAHAAGPARGWGKVWRAVRRVFVALTCLVLGAVAIVVIALQLGYTRDFIRGRVNRAIDSVFRGQLVVDRIGGVGLDRVFGIDGYVLDEQRRRVLAFRGLSVRSNWVPLVRDLVMGNALKIELTPVRLDHVEVLLVDAGDSTPSIATAFNPRETEPSKPETAEKPVTVLIRGVEIGHAWVHGSLPSMQTIDVELSRIAAEFRSDESGIELVLPNARLLTRAMPASLNPSGKVSARLVSPTRVEGHGQAGGPAGDDSDLSGFAKFDGTIADSPASVDADWNGPSIALTAHLPAVTAETWRLLLPSAKVRGATAIHAQVRGRLPSLHLDLSATQQDQSLEVSADARVADGTQVSAILTASEIDLSNWGDAIPPSRLALSARAAASFPSSGEVVGDFRLVSAQGVIAGTEIPSISCAGEVTGDHAGTVVIRGDVDVREPGAPTRGSYRLTIPAKGDMSLRAELDAELSKPRRLHSLLGLEATGSVKVAGDANLTRSLLVAEAKVELESISRGPELQAHALQVELGARGELRNPKLTARANAEQVRLGRRSLQRMRAFATGTPELLDVGADFSSEQRQFALRATVSAGDELAILRPRATLTDREGPIQLQAEQVRLRSRGGVDIKNAEISGIGDVTASASFGAEGFKSQFAMREINLRRVARFVGMHGVDGGTLTLDGQMAGTLEDLRGHLRGQVRHLAAVGLEHGQVELDLKFAKQRVDGTVMGQLGATKLQIRLSELQLPRTPELSLWLDEAQGDVSIHGTLELEQFEPILRRFGAPVERLSGRVLIDVLANHQRLDGAEPLLHVALKTSNLRFVEQRAVRERISSPAEARAVSPRTIEGIDCDLKIDVSPRRKEAQAGLSIHDRHGLLVALVGEAKTPDSFSNWPRALSEMPLRLSVRVPDREVERLPAALRPTTMRGVVAAAIDAQGTIRKPEVRGQFQVRRFQPRAGKNFLDAEAVLSYEPGGGNLRGKARAKRGGTVAVTADWKGDLLGRLKDPDSEQHAFFELAAEAALDRFPLGLIPALFERQIRGPISGTVVLRGLGVNAELDAKLDGSGTMVAGIPMPRLGVAVRATGTELVASADAVQLGGSAHVEVRTRSQWGARLIPVIDPNAQASLRANDFELEVLSPLAAAYLSALEGKLDANLSVQLDPEKPKLEGSATLTEGVLQLPQIGQRFSDVSAKVVVGGGEVRIESIQARGVTGRVTGDARAKLAGLDLKSLDARFSIDEREKLPMTYEGVELGDAWGEADITYAREDERTDIRINVPRFSLTMPDAAQNEVQDLEPPDDIRVGTHRSDGQFVSIPLRPFDPGASEEAATSTTRVQVQLGDAVWIERGSQVRVQITGKVILEAGSQQRIDGRIELKGGKLDVSGKRFEIERGLVKFNEEMPPDPAVTATARYDSPAGYVVYAEYAGTAKDGKLRLRSTPVLTQDEILSLLMFGSPEGSFATSGGGGAAGGIGSSAGRSGPANSAVGSNQPSGGSGSSAAGAAVSVAGGTATKGLNKALSDITTLDVSTRIDTSTGSARPELVMQLTPRLTTRVTRAIGEPAPGQSLDRTFLTLELRLKRSWSASAVIGDHGASRLDLIWRKRY